MTNDTSLENLLDIEAICSEKFDVGGGVKLCFLREMGRERAQLALIIESTSAIDAMENDVRSDIGYYLDQLNLAQGTDVDDPVVWLRLNWYRDFHQGKNCSLIAMQCNLLVMVHLCSAVLARRDGREEVMAQALASARQELEAFRMKDGDIMDEITWGIESIAENRAPWKLNEGPVTRDRARYSIQKLREEIKDRRVVVRSNPRIRAPISEAAKSQGMSFAMDLLFESTDRGGYDKLGKALRKWGDMDRK